MWNIWQNHKTLLDSSETIYSIYIYRERERRKERERERERERDTNCLGYIYIYMRVEIHTNMKELPHASVDVSKRFLYRFRKCIGHTKKHIRNISNHVGIV